MTTEDNLNFCTAKHENTSFGCYGAYNHEGRHWSWSDDVLDNAHPDGTWEGTTWCWKNIPVLETFTEEELAILITALQPVKHFFPGLEAKLHRARAAVQ